MALDIIPFGLVDTALVVPAATSSPTVGCTPAPQTGAMGVNVVITGTADGTFDLIVETAPNDVPAGGNWYQTNSRLNAQTGTGTYIITITDPVLDKVRLRVARTLGTGPLTAQAVWLSDRQPGLTLN